MVKDSPLPLHEQAYLHSVMCIIYYIIVRILKLPHAPPLDYKGILEPSLSIVYILCPFVYSVFVD